MTKSKIQNLFIALFLLPLSSCIPKSIPLEMGDESWGVQVTWHGHSCFTLKDSLGRTIVIDPFDDTVGYGRIRLLGDAVLVTHNHFDHNFIKGVKSRLRNIELVESTGTVPVAGEFLVQGISSDHDGEAGEIHGANRIYTMIMAGLRLVHLGDLGQKKLTALQKAKIGKVDVLFIPVGGFTTLNGKQAKKIINQLKPKVIFPMHYGDTRFYPLEEITAFTNLYPNKRVRNIKEATVQIKKAELTEKPVIFTLVPQPIN